MSDGTTMFENDFARDGRFFAIEELAQSLAIPFDRSTEESCEAGAETVFFRPGLGLVTDVTDCDGESMI